MKFSTFFSSSGRDIMVNPNLVTYLEDLPEGRTMLHFVDGKTEVVELPSDNVKRDLEESIAW